MLNNALLLDAAKYGKIKLFYLSSLNIKSANAK